ncbi:MAG: DNA mismatch repair endonuclease MutL [Bacteroidota bacterium]|nr:DNA mismatch repair endonuclease MutL [Bacteroidota bacterium]
MPNKINILSENLASKIAAGEVVQRPASVVKELLENSIDAGASKITVIIKEGGKSLIQIIDDGCGMSEADASVAFYRHSTSKISTLEDLENIRTLGFRGEALASIAAMSQVELITRTDDDDVATKIRIEGIEIKENSKEAMERGTSVTVRNLFFNTPARREFLKNNSVEFKNIFDVVVRIALSHPYIQFKFISGEETVFNLQSNKIEERIRDIFGNKVHDAILPAISNTDSPYYLELNVMGFITKPDFAKKTRVDQFLFLNNRYIVSRSLNHAVFQAYEHLIEKGSFPFFVLFININPNKVDVNVHPSKMEVKFKEERSVYHLINSTVRNTLSTNNLIPSIQFHTESIDTGRFPEYVPHPNSSFQFQRRTTDSNAPIFSARGDIQNIYTKTDYEKPSEQPSQSTVPQIYFQVHNRYIIIPIEEGVMIVDQHAAHERILYEKAVSSFSETNNRSQQLLFPHTIELSAGDFTIVNELIPNLEKLGFQVKAFGKNTVVMEGVPLDVKSGQESLILQEIVDLYKENEHQQKLEPRDNLAKSFACKAAIKFGDAMNQAEMRSLIEQLFSTQVPYVCPHGRPAIIKLTLSELGKRFGRNV